MKQLFAIFPWAALLHIVAGASRGDDKKARVTDVGKWKIGVPIVTYWAGPGFVSRKSASFIGSR